MKTFLYIAGPYTNPIQSIREHRERILTETAHRFMVLGVPCFSPITHSAPMARLGIPDDFDFWTRMDAPFVKACSHLVCVTLPGFEHSRGLTHEVEQFEFAGKPTFWLDEINTMEDCRAIVHEIISDPHQ